jgi:nanoRNase/pAp phosphatase (c-di-AMP/oligoRNAs hydrolase)
MEGPFEELLALDLTRGELLILTHDNPDPDSVASAAALAFLLRQSRGISSAVAYSGVIGRAENRAMVELLDLRMRQISAAELPSFAHLALIDAQPHTGNSVIPHDRVPDIVIDHHPLREATRACRFFDIRQDVGASATILTEYLRTAGVEIPQDLATALLYGIRSETQDLGREAYEKDFEAYHFLFQIADSEKLAAISRPMLPLQYFTQLAGALDAVLVGDTIALCLVEEVSDPDFVPEMADFLARIEGIEWTLAAGLFRGRMYVSVRSNKPRANAGVLMHELLDELGRGGGHRMRAGGNVDMRERDAGDVRRMLRERFSALTGAGGQKLVELREHPTAPAAATIRPEPPQH